MLFAAIVSMLSALTLYSIGVWGEKRRGRLEKRHALLFWCGFAFDATGTFLMFRMAGGGFEPNLHGMLGLAAIFLMLFTAVAGERRAGARGGEAPVGLPSPGPARMGPLAPVPAERLFFRARGLSAAPHAAGP